VVSAVLFEISLRVLYSPKAEKGKVSRQLYNSGWLVVNPNILADSVRGYRLLPSANTRYSYFTNGQQQINFVQHVNQQGYASKINYEPRKKPGVKRYMVFGDSFSAGLIMDTTWVDYLNKWCAEKNIAAEFYNFSIDGGGMANWYSIYRNEVLGNYEFDGILLAPYIDNLNRMFVTCWQTPECIKAAYLPQQSDFACKEEFGFCTYQPHTDSSFVVFEKEYYHQLEERENTSLLILAFVRGELEWGDPYERGQQKYYSKFLYDGEELPFGQLQKRYSPQNLALLDTLAKELSESSRQLLLASIPDKYVLQKKIEEPGFVALCEKDLQQISKHYAVPLYNGHTAFLNFSKEETERLWLRGDLHWNRHGAKVFAQHYFDFLFSTHIIEPTL